MIKTYQEIRDENVAILNAGNFPTNTGRITELTNVVLDIVDTAEAAISNVSNSIVFETMTNLGTGSGIYKEKLLNEFKLKSLVAGTNITITSTDDEITIDAIDTGEVNTASNLGTGSGIYASKSGVDLQFKSLKAGTNVSLSSDATSITINSTDTGEVNTASNLGTGTGIYAAKSGVDLQFKSLVAGTNISLSSTANDVTINSTAGSKDFIFAYLSADQTANFSSVTPNHIEYNTNGGSSGITLATGSGQANGIFTLQANKKYLCEASFRVVLSSSTGKLVARFRNKTAGTFFGIRGGFWGQSSTTSHTTQYPNTLYGYIETTASTEITVSFTDSASISNIDCLYTSITIREV